MGCARTSWLSWCRLKVCFIVTGDCQQCCLHQGNNGHAISCSSLPTSQRNVRSGLRGLGSNNSHIGICAEALALGDEAEMRRRIRMELDDVARKRALQGYEIPRDFIIDREPFSKANHLLTDSGKPATGRLRNKCAPRLSPGVGLCLVHHYVAG